MRIGIDISIIKYIKTGVEFYIFNLIKSLSKIDKNNQYFLFFYKDVAVDLPSNFTKVLVKIPPNYLLWRQTALPINLNRYKIDVFHSPFMAFPLWGNAKTIVTVYDLAWLVYPQFYTMRSRISYKIWFKIIVKYTDKIIADSMNTKKDILKLYPNVENKIEVVRIATDEKYRMINDEESVRRVKKVYGIDGDFVLAVGTIQPRKNFFRLLYAFLKLKREHKIKHKLVIVGKKGSAYNDLLRTRHKLNLINEVIFTDYIKENDLPYIYNAANLFVYPSIYEGFGIPLLEAMACGVPTIASNTSSLPEVVGDAAILVDPYNIDSLSRAIWDVLTDRELQENLVAKGLERAKLFSWEKTALKTLAIYNQVYEYNKCRL